MASLQVLGSPSFKMIALSLRPLAMSVKMSAPIHSHMRCCSPCTLMTLSRTELLPPMASTTWGQMALRSRGEDLRKRASRIWWTLMVEGHVGSRLFKASYNHVTCNVILLFLPVPQESAGLPEQVLERVHSFALAIYAPCVPFHERWQRRLQFRMLLP